MNSSSHRSTRTSDESPVYRPGPHWVALLAALLTWPLLLVGGTVSVYRFGMAVYDWPTTFGVNMFLFNIWQASWAVFVEHGHRLYGSMVGLACIILAVWFALVEPRRWMKVLGGVALAAVIFQGFLGGYRVRHNSTNLAFFHGCFAEAFFALMVALVVLTGRGWLSVHSSHADTQHLRRRSLVTLFLIFLQIIAGAYVRHFGSVSAVLVHAVLATAVWGHVAWLAWRIERHRDSLPALIPSARAMALAATLQIVLGVAAWWVLRPFDGIPREVSLGQALLRVGHQGVGALLLAASVVLTLRAFRQLRSLPRGSAEPDAPPLVPSHRDLEAVA